MNRRTALVGVGLAIVAIAALIVLSGDEEDGGGAADGGDANVERNDSVNGNGGNRMPPVTSPPLPTIVIDEDGEPVGGVAELTFRKDDQVRFKVESAVADHVHVHGYDLTKDLEPGTAVKFDFPASIEGIFEAELEDRGEQILELRVEP